MDDGVELGKIVKSDSHIRYTCQVYGQGEVPAPPRPEDFAFGGFVRVPLRAGLGSLDGGVNGARADVAALAPLGAPGADALAPVGVGEPGAWAIGVIYDTILVNPAFGTLGPRLSNDEQVRLFSPDYLSERAVLISILLLGTMAPAPAGMNGLNGQPGAARTGPARTASSHLVRHGIPPVAPDLSAVVTTLPEAGVRAFHLFADGGAPGGSQPYLHMGYLPHIIAQDHPLLPLVALQIIERLEQLFPANAALLAIMQRNFAWRLKVQTAG